MVKIFIVDSSKAFCHNLKSSLDYCLDFIVVGFAYDGIDALRQITLEEPDIVLLNTSLTKIETLKVTAIISRLFPKIKVILIGDRYLSVNKLISAGAKGYLPKNIIYKKAELAIRTVHDGAKYFDLKSGNKLLNRRNLPLRQFPQKQQQS